MSKRNVVLLGTVGIVILVLFLHIRTKVPNIENYTKEVSLSNKISPESNKMASESNKMTPQSKAPSPVYGPIKDCKAHFFRHQLDRIKQVLAIKTTPETEEFLYRFGFPKRMTPSGEFYIPDLPDPAIATPEVPVIVAAASSNHFEEMQAMMKNIDTVLRPVYKNLKVILYDIGFTENERKQILKYGKCELRKFAFERYPAHMRKLKNYAWKPILIAEVWREYRTALYMDASIRFTTGNLSAAIQEAKVKGHALMVYRKSPYFVPNNTYPGTFEFFNTKPCLYHKYNEIGTGLMLINKNHLYSYVLMRAWLTCTFQKECAVPKGAEEIEDCKKKQYHACHRYEQSSLGIPGGMLYHKTGDTPSFPLSLFQVKRDQKEKYFT